MKKYEFTDKGWDFNILLRNKITIIEGDSGRGKTVLGKALQAHFVFNKMKVELLDYNTYANTEKIAATIKNATDSLIIIDNADRVLNSDIVELINNDVSNFYLIFGNHSIICS